MTLHASGCEYGHYNPFTYRSTLAIACNSSPSSVASLLPEVKFSEETVAIDLDLMFVNSFPFSHGIYWRRVDADE